MQDEGRFKIVYVNSYHQGHPPSDQITSGLMESLPVDSFEVIAHFMDTKRNPSQEYIETRAAALLDSIKDVNPDLLIVSDGNVVGEKRLIFLHKAPSCGQILRGGESLPLAPTVVRLSL